MSIRALQAKIFCNHNTLDYLWQTHCVFHQRLPEMLAILFNMYRGQAGSTAKQRDLYQRIARFILSCPAQNAPYLLNAVSIPKWKPNSAKKYKVKMKDATGQTVEVTGEAWADEAVKLLSQKTLLYDKAKLLGNLPSCMQQIVSREAVAVISGHHALIELWQTNHEQWCQDKTKWESDTEHQLYLALRPRFDAFEQSVGGQASKRRGRWHLYLDWLKANPDLAAWRGGHPLVHPLSEDAQKRIKKAKPWKIRSVEAQEFWKANPELYALDRLHGEYEKKFVRRRKTKRHIDGFDHRPTFTQPNPVHHPRWYCFNAPQTNPKGYCELQLPTAADRFGRVQLQLITGNKAQSAEYPSAWVPIAFRADPRLAQFRECSIQTTYGKGKAKGNTKTKSAYEYFDAHLQQWRPATISSVKLVFRDIRLNPDGSLKSATPYLIFTCDVQDLPLTDLAAKIQWSETGQTTKAGKPRKNRKLPDGLIACAVDLGLRHVGFATLCEYNNLQCRVLRSRSIHLDAQSTGPDLANLARHKRKLSQLRQLRGKPIPDEESHIHLQDHITHMGEDRFKKAARAILNFAWNTDQTKSKITGQVLPRADVIILESLAGFIPDAERERGINRALVAWNRGQLVERFKQLAENYGYKGRVFEIPPHGTSQVCSKCGAWPPSIPYAVPLIPGSPTYTLAGWKNYLPVQLANTAPMPTTMPRLIYIADSF
ncbi:MAG: hypothetical protein HC898_05255 [Phycisphaerales bacterium]|nr:hypothetical protein [Phycisphaerales bacterium]